MELKHEKELNSNMDIIIKHIGLQVIEKDIKPFYIDVMGFKQIRSFNLCDKESNEIFGIKKNVSILYGTSSGLDFELFVDNDPQKPSFNHVCIQTDDVSQMAIIAKERGYKVFKRKGHKSETIFINDSNRNVFEVKPF